MGKRRIVLRIALTLIWLSMLGFIIFNSLQTGEKSAKTSSTLTDTVQKIVAMIAPQSPIATATGEAYERLHSDIRTIAHFMEFAAFGALTCWCYFAYTNKKKYLSAPIGTIALVPILDEWIQTFSVGRGAEWSDVLVDVFGGVSGFAIAGIVLAVGWNIYRKRLALKDLYTRIEKRVRQLCGEEY